MATEDDLWERTTRSEAVYLDAVTEDATSGFVARVCRFPEARIAWVWLHVFHHGHVHSLTQHDVPDSAEPVAEDSTLVNYDAGAFHFSRSGDRFTPDQATFHASALLHSGPSSPHGEGILPCTIRAEFERHHQGVQSRAGRSEVLGRTRAVIELGDIEFEIDALGQFHEQVQEDPRFNRPFTYASLRGDGAGCIFIRGARGAAGTLTLDSVPHKISSVRIEAPATIRQLDIGLEDGRHVLGEAIATYQYEIPIFHMVRPGTLVTATLEGTALSGCINDLAFGGLAFDHF